MITFYSADDRRRLRRKRTAALIVCAIAALGGLCVCLRLLFTAGTLTATKHELTVYAVNAVCGALALGVYLNAAAPARRALSHFAAVEAGEKETFSFTSLSADDAPQRIPGGVSVRRVTAQNGTSQRRFFVYAPYLDALLRAAAPGEVQISGGYITGVAPQKGGSEE